MTDFIKFKNGVTICNCKNMQSKIFEGNQELQSIKFFTTFSTYLLIEEQLKWKNDAPKS